jgi:chromosome segregation ATPase
MENDIKKEIKKQDDNEVIKLLNEIETLKAEITRLKQIESEYQQLKTEIETLKQQKRGKNKSDNDDNSDLEKIKIEYELFKNENQQLKEQLEQFKKEITQRVLKEKLEGVRDELKEDFIKLYLNDIELVDDKKGIIKINGKVDTLDNYIKHLKKEKPFYFKEDKKDNELDLNIDDLESPNTANKDPFEKEFLKRLRQHGITDISL